ncbi:neutral zinc metallopeptidase [Actinokineospora xionganensis]|uniref:neutral zinc metallopeptidase n=1 Tax=Actinokineospora xionganensis TaxID=2684470 RepID=UPI0028AB76A0|nr:neutral zinc metallopeptidase [Actinokineospora xionganensis]
MRLPIAVGRPVPVLLALALAATVTACTSAIPGKATSQGSVVSREDPNQPGGVDPSFVENTDNGEIDRLAATVITDVRTYWTEQFPKTFGEEFNDLKGGYFSVDTADADSDAPPCADKADEVEGNAFYCPTADVIAWDRAALLPVLRDRFGEAAVMLVLAHEMGHAVQNRTGVGLDARKANPSKFPTILIEAMADCYAGSFVRWVADGKAKHLNIAKERLDSALESLISFRDPIGTEQTDRGAHGDAFDRVSAFQDGYEKGVDLCAKMTVDNRTFTLSGFIDAGDQARGGNLRFDQIVQSISPGLNTYFSTLMTKSGKTWVEPKITTVDDAPECGGGEQGPVAFCGDGGALEMDGKKELPEIHIEIGDYATGALLASRYGLAALAAAGKPVEGPDAQRSAVCLAGSFTGSLFSAEQRFLSPGDLDEAIQVLLDYDYAARDAKGDAIDAGFDRVIAFREGFTGGGEKCGLS